MKTLEMVSERTYSYVVVHGVRTAPAIAVGMKVALAYVEMTVEDAVNLVHRVHPDVNVTGVTKYE